MNKQAGTLGFYLTPQHPCSYLPDEQATTLFADPGFPMNQQLYTRLAARGFRRSGEFLYQPRCSNCHACIPVRIPVHEYNMGRRHRRIWKRNQDLLVNPKPAGFEQAHFDLYTRYIHAKHPGAGMDNPDHDNYMGFLTSTWMNTLFYEIKLDDLLLAVAVVDTLDDGYSAVYTFYDPDYQGRSLGTFAILVEIHEAHRLGLDWLYLGYWIEKCEKMNYKNQFQPIQYLLDNRWVSDPAQITPVLPATGNSGTIRVFSAED